MSSYIKTFDAKCQECEKRFLINKTISTVINLDTDNFEKDLFINDKLNKVECPFCHTEFTYEVPLVVFSFSAGFAFLVMPDADMATSIPLKTPPVFLFGRNFRCRIVNYLVEALEKYKIEQYLCNDYIIEYIKLKSFDDTAALPTDEVNLLFESKDEDNYYFVQTDYNNCVLNRYKIAFPDKQIPENVFEKSKRLNNYMWHKINRIKLKEEL